MIGKKHPGMQSDRSDRISWKCIPDQQVASGAPVVPKIPKLCCTSSPSGSLPLEVDWHQGRHHLPHILRWPGETVALPAISAASVRHSVLTGGSAEVNSPNRGSK